MVCSKAESFRNLFGAFGQFGRGCFVAYVYGEGVGLAVVGAFELVDMKVFWSSPHMHTPFVLGLWSLCRRLFTRLVFAITQSFGV